MDKAMRYLCLAKKAGRLLIGKDSCKKAFSSGKARLLLLAADASENAKKEARRMAAGHRAPLAEVPFLSYELGAALGKGECSLVCFTDLPLAARFASAMAETTGEWVSVAEQLAAREAKAERRKAAPRKHEHE